MSLAIQLLSNSLNKVCVELGGELGTWPARLSLASEHSADLQPLARVSTAGDRRGLCRVGSWDGKSIELGFPCESPQRSPGLGMGRGKSGKVGMPPCAPSLRESFSPALRFWRGADCVTWVPLPGISDGVSSWWKFFFSSGICEQSPPSKLRIVSRRRNCVHLAVSGNQLTVCVMYFC